MKNLIAVLVVALFSAGMNVNAQETKPKETPKKECSAKDKKACAKDHKTCSAEEKKACDKTKKACCAAKTEKKA
ncbi:hypothetical protein FNW52_07045 [Flavobacterium sp. ZT3R18]|uniref:hypothetical protein n=1 Tax=Flavobacterium sp. ZT3R18 TaxID=2594429 RepID=UPI00117A3C48|nr:hypothetical protein [Flavobacterium sp. ZT3R18]TRX36989.1 hypothetical protein FNW52_07045 [Flavobacterium sp. ZT3R18]